MYTLVSLLTVSLGIFVTVKPEQAAKVWGWKNLDKLGPSARTWYFRVYRGWGVLLCIAGILMAAGGSK